MKRFGVPRGGVYGPLVFLRFRPPRLPVMLLRCTQRFDIRAIVPRFARESLDAFEGKPRLQMRSEIRGVTKQATEGDGASVPFRSHAGVPNLLVPIWWLALF